MHVICHQVVGKYRDRDEVLEEFYRCHEKYNGNRRKNPREYTRILKVRQQSPGTWRIYYTVPAQFRAL